MRNTQQEAQNNIAPDSQAPAEPRMITSAQQENEGEAEGEGDGDGDVDGENENMEEQAPEIDQD